jgi:hypothetical protein
MPTVPVLPPILPCITEFNLSYNNKADDGPEKKGTNSFLAGQYWADMLSLAMKEKLAFINFWSVIEGSNTSESKGYLNRTSEKPLSTYFIYLLPFPAALPLF